MRAATDWASSAGPPEPPAFGGARTRCVRPTFQLTIAEVSMQPNVPRGNSRHSVAAGSLTEAKASPMTTTPTPPPEQHAAAHLDRATLTISRASEYLDAAELQAQTGVARERFAVAVLKELVDNALDAAEARGDPPEIAVTAATDVGLIRLVVADNGPGIDPATVGQILDYNQRVSSKLHYPSPTRGQLGNALKVVLGIPFASGARTRSRLRLVAFATRSGSGSTPPATSACGTTWPTSGRRGAPASPSPSPPLARTSTQRPGCTPSPC